MEDLLDRFFCTYYIGSPIYFVEATNFFGGYFKQKFPGTSEKNTDKYLKLLNLKNKIGITAGFIPDVSTFLPAFKLIVG
jgi:hypothetical protein